MCPWNAQKRVLLLLGCENMFNLYGDWLCVLVGTLSYAGYFYKEVSCNIYESSSYLSFVFLGEKQVKCL